MICVLTLKMVRIAHKGTLIITISLSFHQNPGLGMHQTVHNYKILSVCPCAAPMIYFIEFCE